MRETSAVSPAPYLKEAFLDWERLRLLYNLLLVLSFLRFTVTWTGDSERIFSAGRALPAYLLIIAIANVFYCLGPLIEFYLDTFLRLQLHTTRRILFVAGCAFSLLMIEVLTRFLP